MYVWGLTETQLKKCADAIGVDISFGNPKGKALSCKIRWNKDKTPNHYRHKRISFFGERNTNSVCFHGHFDFMFEIFEHNLEARIKSGYYGEMDYRGRDDFFTKVPETAATNIGAPIMPVFMIESCDCGAFGYGIKHDIPSDFDRTLVVK